MYALEAPYAQYISPVAIRRMSRIMKMTISAAMQCLADADIKTPDAIITGTGRGGVTDMELFVKDMLRLDEGAMNPTSFIQSTYNSPNGWIAMQSNCTCYNQTYVHRGCSFELALLDAQMLLAEADSIQNMLVGCYDEMTEDYFHIRAKRGYWKDPSVDSGLLLANNTTPGTVGGEGVSFFTLSNAPKQGIARLMDLAIIYEATAESLNVAVKEMLQSNGMSADSSSVVLAGINGDCRQEILYQQVLRETLKTMPVAAFKHLCGEYDTASGFGLWLANRLLTTQNVPMEAMTTANIPESLSYVLLINHYILGTASVMLIGR